MNCTLRYFLGARCALAYEDGQNRAYQGLTKSSDTNGLLSNDHLRLTSFTVYRLNSWGPGVNSF